MADSHAVAAGQDSFDAYEISGTIRSEPPRAAAAAGSAWRQAASGSRSMVRLGTSIEDLGEVLFYGAALTVAITAIVCCLGRDGSDGDFENAILVLSACGFSMAAVSVALGSAWYRRRHATRRNAGRSGLERLRDREAGRAAVQPAL